MECLLFLSNRILIPTKLTLVRLQQMYDDDTHEKLETPIIDGGSIKANLYGLQEFREAAEELTFDTGDEIFTYFCHILPSTNKDNWDTVVSDNGFDGVNGKMDINYSHISLVGKIAQVRLYIIILVMMSLWSKVGKMEGQFFGR
jgi:hypothetical protein